MKNEIKKNENVSNEVNAQELIEQYTAQTENNDDIHFEHYDWTYNDSSCCC